VRRGRACRCVTATGGSYFVAQHCQSSRQKGTDGTVVNHRRTWADGVRNHICLANFTDTTNCYSRYPAASPPTARPRGAARGATTTSCLPDVRPYTPICPHATASCPPPAGYLPALLARSHHYTHHPASSRLTSTRHHHSANNLST